MWLVLDFELILTNFAQWLMYTYNPFNISHIMNGQKWKWINECLKGKKNHARVKKKKW